MIDAQFLVNLVGLNQDAGNYFTVDRKRLGTYINTRVRMQWLNCPATGGGFLSLKLLE